MKTTTEIGAAAEQLAADHLAAAGYRVVARNHRCQGGEVDIVAWDGDVLCFVEVRSRKDDRFGHPLETISATKIRRVARGARDFLRTLRGARPTMRFDAVGILLSDPPEITLVRDAFEI